MKKFSSATAWVIVFVLVILAATMLVRTNQNTSTINFNEFQKNWIDNKVTSIEIREDKMTVDGTLKDGTNFETIVPSERLFQFIGEHPNNGSIKESYAKPASVPAWVTYLPTIILMLMLVAFWFMFMQQSQGGGGNRNVMNFGKSRKSRNSRNS